MIDINQLKANYASMADGELKALLAQPETLRREAFLALKFECRRRGMNPEIIDSAEEAIVNLKIDNIRSNMLKEERSWWKAIWRYAFEQKYNDSSDDAIIAGLLGMNASVEESIMVVNTMEKKAAENLKDAEADAIAGLIKLVCGLAVVVIVLMAALGNTPNIYGGLIAVAGLLQMSNASYRKNRFKIIISNILEQQHNDDLPTENVSVY